MGEDGDEECEYAGNDENFDERSSSLNLKMLLSLFSRAFIE
jgi:hypothetical protein